MKIVTEVEQDVISESTARTILERQINDYTNHNEFAENYIYVIKYEGRIISISTQYYKFAYKSLGFLRRALSLKFGKDLADALVESNIIQIEKVLLA